MCDISPQPMCPIEQRPSLTSGMWPSNLIISENNSLAKHVCLLPEKCRNWLEETNYCRDGSENRVGVIDHRPTF